MSDASRISLQSLARAIVMRWRIALSVALLIFVVTAAYIFSLKPAYTSTAVVLLAPDRDELIRSSSDRAAMTDPFFVRSESSIMSSDELSRSVVERLKLWEFEDFSQRKGVLESLGLRKNAGNRFFSEHEVVLDGAVRYYNDKLSIFNDGRNNTVEISFTASDPRIAAEIANAHADAYLQKQSARRLLTQQKAIEWLSREVDARAADVREADSEIQKYQLKNGLVSANNSTLVEQRLSQLNTQLVEARRQLSTQTTLLEELRKMRSGEEAGNAAALLTDEPLKNLLQSRVEKEAAVAALEKRLAANHPTLVKQRQELESLNKVLYTQIQRAEDEAAISASWWQKQVDELNVAVDAESSRKVDQDRLAAGLPGLTTQADVKRAVFQTVLNKYQTLLTEGSFATPSATIVSRAVPSARPSFPKTTLFLVIAAMVSTFGGAISAIGLQLRKKSSTDLVPLADALGVRPLVAVPRFRNSVRSDGVVCIEDPLLFVESIRFLRDAVLGRQHGRQSTTCLVTSVRPRQGKSLVAMSLARAIARAGRKTLFMEIDLRQPTGAALARRQPPAKGIAAVLEGHAATSEVVVQDESTGLDMLLAEADAKRSLDRLTTVTLRHLLAKLRGRYDVIVIDSPPVGLVSDALVLTSLVEQTVVVAREGDSSVEELRRGVRLLQDRGGHIAGLVLTSVEPTSVTATDKRTLHRYLLGVPDNHSEQVRQGKLAV